MLVPIYSVLMYYCVRDTKCSQAQFAWIDVPQDIDFEYFVSYISVVLKIFPDLKCVVPKLKTL